MKDRQTTTLAFRTITTAVAAEFGVPRAILLSNQRTAVIAGARQVAMYYMRTLYRYSYPEIARAFRKADHTTAMHACSTVANRLQTEPVFSAQLGRCSMRILDTLNANLKQTTA